MYCAVVWLRIVEYCIYFFNSNRKKIVRFTAKKCIVNVWPFNAYIPSFLVQTRPPYCTAKTFPERHIDSTLELCRVFYAPPRESARYGEAMKMKVSLMRQSREGLKPGPTCER